MLVDERSWLGGTVDLGRHGRRAAAPARGSRPPRPRSRARRRSPCSPMRPRSASTTTGTWWCTSASRADRAGPHVRARRVVLATGAHERPIAFADNDLPGVMLASAARRTSIASACWRASEPWSSRTNHAGHEAAMALAAAGMRHRRDRRRRRGRPGERRRRERAASTSARGWAVLAADGDPGVRSVTLVGPGGAVDTVEADLRARLRRLEPDRAALARHRRRPAIRRAAGVLRARRCRAAVALRRRRRSRRGAHERAVLVHAGRRPVASTSSTCSATRRSPTCSTPSATSCVRPST